MTSFPIDLLNIGQLNCFIFTWHKKLMWPKQIGLKCGTGHALWDSLSKIATPNTQFHPCLYFLCSKHDFSKNKQFLESLSNDSANLNVPNTQILNKY